MRVRECVCVCACERERESVESVRVSVRVRVRERERVWRESVRASVCVSVKTTLHVPCVLVHKYTDHYRKESSKWLELP